MKGFPFWQDCQTEAVADVRFFPFRRVLHESKYCLAACNGAWHAAKRSASTEPVAVAKSNGAASQWMQPVWSMEVYHWQLSTPQTLRATSPTLVATSRNRGMTWASGAASSSNLSWLAPGQPGGMFSVRNQALNLQPGCALKYVDFLGCVC